MCVTDGNGNRQEMNRGAGLDNKPVHMRQARNSHARTASHATSPPNAPATHVQTKLLSSAAETPRSNDRDSRPRRNLPTRLPDALHLRSMMHPGRDYYCLWFAREWPCKMWIYRKSCARVPSPQHQWQCTILAKEANPRSRLPNFHAGL